jgi:hypothetical protein
MNLHVVKRGLMAELRSGISTNLDRYLEGNFDDILTPELVIAVKDTEVDLELITKLKPESGGEIDVENSLVIYEALKGINRYLARDERLWVWLTHGPCLDYARKRWIPKSVPRDQKISLIKTHFFAAGARGFERNNAVAALWWWAEIVSKYPHADLKTALQVFLHQTDVRANIIERPTSSQSALVPVLNVLMEKYNSEERVSFFKREKGNKAIYRRWLSEINRYGGIKFYEALPEKYVTELFLNLADQARKSIESEGMAA